MRLYKRNGTFYIALPGEKRLSLKTSDREKANKALAKLEKEYRDRPIVHLDKLERKSLSQFIGFYAQHRPGMSEWTLKKDMLSLKLLMDVVGDIQIRAISASKIDEFKTVCLARKARPITINGYLRHIKTALNYARDNQLIEKRPKIKALPVNKERLEERIVPPDKIKKIFTVAKNNDPWLWRYLTILLWTGARRKEILWLNWQNVNLNEGCIYLKQTKGRRDRRVKLLQPALDVFKEMLKERQGEPHEGAEPVVPVGKIFPEWHPDNVSKMFHAIVTGLDYKYRLHDLRHSAISYMLDSGVPLHVVQKMVGHASVVTTMLYVHVRDEVSDRELEKFKIE